MTYERFNEILEARIRKSQSVMSKKEKEYAREDRLQNFKTAARKRGCTPEEALYGMMLKHDVSVSDMVEDVRLGIVPTVERVDEKIGDLINYLILLEALLIERIENEKV